MSKLFSNPFSNKLNLVIKQNTTGEKQRNASEQKEILI